MPLLHHRGAFTPASISHHHLFNRVEHAGRRIRPICLLITEAVNSTLRVSESEKTFSFAWYPKREVFSSADLRLDCGRGLSTVLAIPSRIQMNDSVGPPREEGPVGDHDRRHVLQKTVKTVQQALFC